MTNLTSLRTLHLHECLLFGRLPSNVLLSPTLQSIDLGFNPDLEGSLPEFNGNNSLTYLELSDTSFLGNIPNSISKLKHLSVLRFQGCSFTGKIPSSIGNLSQLTILHLSYNNFFGEIPSSFPNLKQMTNLHVSYNKLSGNFPSVLLNLTNLSDLGISYNQFTGKLPPNFTSLPNLKSFYASENSFTGTLPSSLFTLPFLDAVYLSDNQYNGTLEFGNVSSPSKLTTLDIRDNNFIGPIPRSISKFVNLKILDLSHFNTQGPVDFSIFSHLKSLQYLHLSHLNTTTTIDLNAILSCCKSLSSLDLSGNRISAANMRLPSSQLSHLKLSGCGIREFPEFIKTQRLMARLDLSNNKIRDQVPGWLWSLPELDYVDLSNNSFSGFDEFTRDSLISPVKVLYLSKNNLSGEIPKSICGMSSLQILDFARNNLNGTVPYCFIILIQRDLLLLNLGENRLSGKLPDIFLNGSNLRSLGFGHNQLTGKLPRSLSGCSSLTVLNLEHNSFNDTFPFWLKSLQDLEIMLLRSNEFHGWLEQVATWFPRLQVIDISDNAFTGTLPSDIFNWSVMSLERDRSELKYIGESSYYQNPTVFMNKGLEMEYKKILTIFTFIDLSRNRFQGAIPKSIGLLKNLKVLNLSRNAFNGNIPSALANLAELESLDLSHNQLSGQIPPALGDLTSLSNITMSHNKLVGPIPQRSQFQTQSASSFEGNLGLCGLPLTEKCGAVDTDKNQSQATESEEGVVSWTAAAIALAPGVIFGLTIGHIVMITQKPRWLVRILESL